MELIRYLFLTVGDVADSTPREGLLWIEFAIGAVGMKSLCVDAEQELLVSFVLLGGRTESQNVFPF